MLLPGNVEWGDVRRRMGDAGHMRQSKDLAYRASLVTLWVLTLLWGMVCPAIASGPELREIRFEKGGDLILRLASAWGGRILNSPPGKRHDEQKKAMGQPKMRQTAKKRKQRPLEKRISGFLRPDSSGLFPSYSS